MQRFDSVREKDFNLNFCTTKKEIIFNLLSLTAEIKENHFHLHTLIWMLDWTFHARGLSLEFGPIEVKIYMEHSDGFHAS